MPVNDQTTTMHATELRALIADVLELPIDEITDASRFIDDLEVDSLASLQIAVQVEKRFGVSIGENPPGVHRRGGRHAEAGRVADGREVGG